MSSVNIPSDVEAHLANMTGDEWETFAARVRPPDLGEAFRETASRWISGDRLNALVAVAHHSLYRDDDGNIDAGKVERQLRALFDDIPKNPPAHQNFGQHQPERPMPGPGDRGNAEVQKRFHGAKPPGSSAGNAEAAKRFGGHP